MAYYWFDTFTGSAGTALPTYNSIWATPSGGSALILGTGGTNARGNVGGRSINYVNATVDPVQIAWTMTSATQDSKAGPAIRVQTGAQSYFYALYETADGKVYAGETVAGSSTDWDAGQAGYTLGTHAIGLMVDPVTTTTIYLLRRTATSAWTVVATYTGKNALTGGYVGVVGSGGVGVGVDNFEGGDLPLISQMLPTGPGPYYQIPDKTSSGVVSINSAGDSVVLVLSEGTTSQETEAYEFPVLRLAELANVLVIPPIPQDSIVLVLADIAQPPLFVGPAFPVSAVDNPVLILAESVAVAIAVATTDSIVLVVTDALSGPIAISPNAVNVTDSIILVLSEASSYFEAHDSAGESIVLVIAESSSVTDTSAPTAITATESIIPVITEGAGSVAVAITSAGDSVVLVILDVVSAPINTNPTAVSTTDSVVLVVTDTLQTIQQILPFLALDVSDLITPKITEGSQLIVVGSDVDRITFNLKPYGKISFNLQ